MSIKCLRQIIRLIIYGPIAGQLSATSPLEVDGIRERPRGKQGSGDWWTRRGRGGEGVEAAVSTCFLPWNLIFQ
jgi:hypothetical protein